MRSCERCKLPLIDDRAGYSADGRLVCTRTGCQLVEEINRHVASGGLEIVDASEFEVEIVPPTKKAFNKTGLTIATHFEALYRKPLPPEADSDVS